MVMTLEIDTYVAFVSVFITVIIILMVLQQ